MVKFHFPHVQEIKKIKVSTIIAICFILLLFFYILNILVLFFLLKVANLISESYTKVEKVDQDVFGNTFIEEKPWKQDWESPEPSWSFSCDTTHYEYDICYLNRLTIVDPTTQTLSVPDSSGSTPSYFTRIRPYPRKGQREAMIKTKQLTLTTSPLNKTCTVTHHTPTLIFSAGGYTGNVFHDFNEGWISLYVTINELFNDHDVILGIINCTDSWLEKYKELFPHFSRHPIINLDKETDVHCFPYGIVGLQTHGVMIVDPTLQSGPRPKTMLDFRALLVEAYRTSKNDVVQVLPSFTSSVKPKMAFVVRKDTRKLVNEQQVKKAAEEVGFEVIVFVITKDIPMRELFRLINSSHVLMGVHGQGLTHELFLQTGAVLIQIIPLNTGWLADTSYGKLAKRLGIEHIIYEISFNESSLRVDDFAKKVNSDPGNLDSASALMDSQINWDKYMNQDVEVDVARFRRYLKKAYIKAKKLMMKQAKRAAGVVEGHNCIRTQLSIGTDFGNSKKKNE